mmetsp:Transcript_12537/g.11129  ORF Transcript_12537/g.11129 Transcript_12537/m.11129 type:complete len:271 (+) Transcript_12537:40-852(+)
MSRYLVIDLWEILLLSTIIISSVYCQPFGDLRPTPELGPDHTAPPTRTDDSSVEFSSTGLDDDTCCGCIERTREPGCESDPVCEDTVCGTINERCCTRRWQNDCVAAALVICSNLETCCGCLNPSNNGRCINDDECTNIICDIDSYCCNNQWDSICVVQANAVCNDEDIPHCCSCTSQSNFNGCLTDSQCEEQICEQDPFCCGQDENGQGSWDQLCVNQAVSICQGTATTNSPNGDGDGDGLQNSDNDNGNDGLQSPFDNVQPPPFRQRR